MMDDRELLELAARAAGISPARWISGCEYLGLCTATPGPFKSWWNPLCDDGDALDLTVLLGLGLQVCRDWTDVTNGTLIITENFNGDPNAATRRAIVRAAAAIAHAEAIRARKG